MILRLIRWEDIIARPYVRLWLKLVVGAGLLESRAYNILIVDGQPIFRGGLRSICESLRGIEGILEAQTAEDALERVRMGSIGLLITDIALPRQDGLWLLEEIRQTHPDLPILMCSALTSSKYVLASMRAGANGFLTKEATREEMTLAIKDIRSGHGYIHSLVAHCLIDQVRSAPAREVQETASMTSREREIFDLVAEGVSTTEISERLFLSVSTIKTHLRALYRKYEVSSRTQLALKALESRQSFDLSSAS